MPRPKPPEEYEQVNVRLPESVAAKIGSLAKQSNAGDGMSRNRYCALILEEAAKLEITLTELRGYRLNKRGSLFDTPDDDKATKPET